MEYATDVQRRLADQFFTFTFVDDVQLRDGYRGVEEFLQIGKLFRLIPSTDSSTRAQDQMPCTTLHEPFSEFETETAETTGDDVDLVR